MTFGDLNIDLGNKLTGAMTFVMTSDELSNAIIGFSLRYRGTKLKGGGSDTPRRRRVPPACQGKSGHPVGRGLTLFLAWGGFRSPDSALRFIEFSSFEFVYFAPEWLVWLGRESQHSTGKDDGKISESIELFSHDVTAGSQFQQLTALMLNAIGHSF